MKKDEGGDKTTIGIKKATRGKQTTMIEKQCDQCNKVVQGYNKKHVNYMLAQHQLAKHPEKKEEE